MSSGIAFDVVIVIKAEDWNIAERSIPYIKKNIKPNNVVLISSKKLESKIKESGCLFLDEENIFDGMTVASIAETLQQLGSLRENAGWYLQQFIKLSYAYVCKSDYYLVWDSDTLPLKEIPFFDENDRPFFNLKREFFRIYFNTIKNIFNYEKTQAESYISEHMLLKVSIVKDMLSCIVKNPNLKGENFWQKILSGCDFFFDERQRAFSEFETYGTFVDKKYPNFYAKRKLDTLRIGANFLGHTPSSDVLDWAGKDFDIISFEIWSKEFQNAVCLAENAEYRKTHSFAKLIEHIRFLKRLCYIKDCITFNWKGQFEYSKFKGLFGFDFFFDNRCFYGRKTLFVQRVYRGIMRRIFILFGFEKNPKRK